MAETVTVACKLPNGLYLQLYKMVESGEPTPAGMKPVEKAEKVGDPIRINGFRTPLMFQERPTVGGYGLTHNVPAKFFNEWLAQNKDLEIVQKKLIFAHPKEPDARAAAQEHASTKCGLEPYVPPRIEGGKSIPQDPRHPRSINPNLTEIQTDTGAEL